MLHLGSGLDIGGDSSLLILVSLLLAEPIVKNCIMKSKFSSASVSLEIFFIGTLCACWYSTWGKLEVGNRHFSKTKMRKVFIVC